MLPIYREGHGLRSAYAVQDLLITRLFEGFLGIWVFVVGSCVASFLNVVAYRLPAGLPVTGTSFCPYCRESIRPSDNVPILGWILLGGRCRTCSLSISPRYPIFELLGGLLALSVFLSTVLSHGANLPFVRGLNMTYGLPVNLNLIDERIFYVAGFHCWLLFFLYAGALASFGGGQLPNYVWTIGGAGILLAIAFRSDVCVQPLADSRLLLYLHFDSPPMRAIVTSAFGCVIAWAIAFQWRVHHPGWIPACCLIGLALGWQASLWILGFTVIAQLLQTQLPDRNAVDRQIYSVVRSFDEIEPLRLMWLWTAIFLILWHWLQNFLDIL